MFSAGNDGLTESLFDMALCCSWGTADAIFDSVAVSKGWSELSLEEVRPMIRRLQNEIKKKFNLHILCMYPTWSEFLKGRTFKATSLCGDKIWENPQETSWNRINLFPEDEVSFA